MDYPKLILDAWPMLWVLPLFFGILTCVVTVNQICAFRAFVATRSVTRGLTARPTRTIRSEFPAKILAVSGKSQAK
jgi:hypothetical protein